MTLWRAAASLAAPQSRDENVPVMILTPSRVISRFAALVDHVADDLVPLEVSLALARERARERFEHADLVLARERLAVDAGAGGAEDDGERGHDGDDGPAVHTRPPGW